MAHRRLALVMLAMLCAAVVAYLLGCSPDTELGGTPIPNSLPDTRITGQPPSILEAGFEVTFFWTGSDPDGRVAGFQWKLSNNGTDGISVQDTLTIDPATGDTLNAWHFTTGTDTSLVVSADIGGFPRDQENYADARDWRSFQTHTLFVRAVDLEGGVDPTPAFLSFTATTLVPTVAVDKPIALSGGYQTAQPAPPTVTLGWSGVDPDYELGNPTKVRTLWKRAFLNGRYLKSRYDFQEPGVMEQLVSFSDSAWSPWIRYDPDVERRLITFANQQEEEDGEIIYYVFAVQAQDTAGAVSVERIYGRNVHNIFIVTSKTPQLTVEETNLGRTRATGRNKIAEYPIAGGQPLEFSWVATAEDYAGSVVAYRYGWDVSDPSDPEDPDWAISRGNSDAHRKAPIRSFGTGTHTLTVQAWDNSDQMTRIRIILEVVPVPDPGAQLPALLIDDVVDQFSNAWLDASGVPRDRDRYRDDFWTSVLTGSGGVENYSSARDVKDIEADLLTYRDAVRYKVLIWTSKKAQENYIETEFQPDRDGNKKFVWLASYQENVGNLLMVGTQSMEQFVENRRGYAGWMLPIVFDTDEEDFAGQNNDIFSLGFGARELPDGTEVLRGPERYPYQSMGISLISHIQPKSPSHVYGDASENGSGFRARAARCCGVVGLILDPGFKDRYIPEGGAFADTIFTERVIDYHDYIAADRNRLDNSFIWGLDEFYNENIEQRPTPWQPLTDCGVGEADLCVEPMFRSYSRYDWVDDVNEAAGIPEWPSNIFPGDMEDICGDYAFDDISGRTTTSGLKIGIVSHRTETLKPSGKGDVLWGFDPYRFNNREMRKVIQWVLGEHFNLTMLP